MVLSRYDKISCTCNKNKWCCHDRISLGQLEQESFYISSQFLRIGFSMRYKTFIFFITVGLVSLLYPPWKSGRNSYTNNVSGSSSSLIWELRGMQKNLEKIKGFSIKHELSVTHHHVSFSNTQIKHELSIPHHHVS